VVEALAASKPARIVYVACDPVALARDLATFSEHGWRPVSLEAFDLFPNTHHLEAVAALEPA
jgi:tRNA/tmRNA/rRNA uracil-C5-methylase (TrmA/RlmC/RlmD family)